MPVYIKGNSKRRTKKFISSHRRPKNQLKKKGEVYAFSKFVFLAFSGKLTMEKFSCPIVNVFIVSTITKLFEFSKS